TPTGSRAARAPIRVDPSKQILAQALFDARDGDRIWLLGDVAEADLKVLRKDVTIEPDPSLGRKVTWRCPATPPQAANHLLLVSAVSGFQLKDVVLDGGNKLDHLVVLFGRCPGTLLERLELQHYRKAGLYVSNCQGTRDRPVRFTSLRFDSPAGSTAVLF